MLVENIELTMTFARHSALCSYYQAWVEGECGSTMLDAASTHSSLGGDGDDDEDDDDDDDDEFTTSDEDDDDDDNGVCVFQNL